MMARTGGPIPSRWSARQLGDLVEVISGKTPRGIGNVIGGTTPFYKVADMNRSAGKRMAESAIYLDDEAVVRYRMRLAPAGSVIFPKVGGALATNKKRVLSCSAAFDTNTMALVPSTAMVPEFLFYLMERIDLRDYAYGSPVQQVDRKALLSLSVALPPLDEQRRMVAAIEERVSHLDAGLAMLRRARINLERMRSAVLEAAVRGWLLRRKEAAPITSGGTTLSAEDLHPLPAGWRWERAGDLTEVQGGIQKQPKRRPGDNAHPYLRVANVLRGRLDLDEIGMMELFPGELEKLRLLPGDLLVVEGNGSRDQIGRSALWLGEIQDCVHQNHIIRVRPGPSLLPAYLDIYWNSPGAAERLQRMASTTSGLYTLSTQKVKSTLIVVPPINEQAEIVTEVDRQVSLIETLTRECKTAVARCDSLRRSILGAAFSGDLLGVQALASA